LEPVDKKTLNVPTETAASINSDSLSQTHTFYLAYESTFSVTST
jgi:hypothetical protein